MSRALFVTGTGTDVGKTFVSGLLLKKLHECGQNAAYYKAAMSGNDRDEQGNLIPGDALSVKTVSGIPQPLGEMCPYVYETAVSPHLAAKLEGNPVDLDTVLQGFDALCGQYDFILAEGSGGILCPLRFDSQELYLEDVIKARNLPCVIVADAGLGTINAVVLTASYMNSHSLNIKGILFNHFEESNPMHTDNLKMCEHLTGLPVLACIKDGDTDLDIDEAVLEGLFEEASL